VAIFAAGGIYSLGHHRGFGEARTSCELERAKSVERAIAQERDIAAQDAEVSRRYEAGRNARVAAAKIVEKEVIREIPANCAQCRLSPTGLGLLNDALAGSPDAAATTPGEPSSPMRPPKPFGGWHLPGTDAQDFGAIRKAL
jgi:hypothetical protein